MVLNIEKVLERGEKLDILAEETTELLNVGNEFSSGARQVKQNANMKKWILVGVLALIIITIIVVILILALGIICNFPSFSRCSNSQ